VAFIAFMSAGFALAIAGLPLPHVESAIVVSVIVLGLLVIFAARVPMSLAIAVIGFFALCHGYAHGVEAPAAGYLLFAAGTAAATAALHLAGIAVGARFLRRPRPFGTAGARA
jgi:urease accessory protein